MSAGQKSALPTITRDEAIKLINWQGHEGFLRMPYGVSLIQQNKKDGGCCGVSWATMEDLLPPVKETPDYRFLLVALS